MEFGIFIQGHVPRTRLAEDPDYEHTSLVNDMLLAREADKAGFKYVWLSEHHFLDEYSHLSANEIACGYLAAATENIHIATGIFNITPPVNHPVRIAERVALLDHLSEGRFELGVGRGAGSREVTGFGIPNTDATKDMFEEVIHELPRMWRETEYSFEGKYFSVPPRNILPKPWRKPHPPIWQSAGNPPTYAKAARSGFGVLGFNFSSWKQMEPNVKAYKDAIVDAEPIGDYVNDNVMITSSVVCLEDGRRAREVAASRGSSLLQCLVGRYHDTFPKPSWMPDWPTVLPEPTVEEIEERIRDGYILCGDPDEVVDQMKDVEGIGVDQIVFGLPIAMRIEDAIESIRLFGERVLPKFDQDPVHRSTRFREAAAARV
jgi:alkanesulfonate monooxygenase SsuD/methylene tetrahydromethanopterin reductase-like flavin-dependent oxidoreductase (luciferase family)